MYKNISTIKFQLFLIFSFLLLSYSNSFAQVGIATTTPLSTFEVNGSVGQTITTVTSSLTLDASHNIIICDNGSQTCNVALPNSVGIKGRIYSIKRSESSTEKVTITPTSNQLIDGELNFVLAQSKETVSIISDGLNWKVISNYLPQTPVGELSYFNTTGTEISINSATIDGTSNLFFCNPTTTISTESVNFNSPQNGRLQYIGTAKKSFLIKANLTATPNANGTYLYQFRKSNTSFLSNSKVMERLNLSEEKTTTIQAFVSLNPNDFIELWIGKIGDTGNITIKSFNLFAQGL